MPVAVDVRFPPPAGFVVPFVGVINLDGFDPCSLLQRFRTESNESDSSSKRISINSNVSAYPEKAI